MKAIFYEKAGFPLKIKDINIPKPTKDQVLVKLHYAALNHLELFYLKERKQADMEGVIWGADGSGMVVEVGEGVDQQLIGRSVVINPGSGWGDNPLAQSDSFQILGYPQNGTFCEYISISKEDVFLKPEYLTKQEGAAIPLAGLTAYRAVVTKAQVQKDERVLITGVGGGAALFAFQFALAKGAKVYVTSGSDTKIEKAMALGASGGYNYKDPEWHVKAMKDVGGFDVIIDGAGGSQFSKLLELTVTGGRVVNYGRTAGDIIDFPARQLFWKQITLHGTSMGTPEEFASMLSFMEKHQVRPVIDRVYPLEKIEEAFEWMESGNQFGKILLQITV